jgi:hypothetical protein
LQSKEDSIGGESGGGAGDEVHVEEKKAGGLGAEGLEGGVGASAQQQQPQQLGGRELDGELAAAGTQEPPASLNGRSSVDVDASSNSAAVGAGGAAAAAAAAAAGDVGEEALVAGAALPAAAADVEVAGVTESATASATAAASDGLSTPRSITGAVPGDSAALASAPSPPPTPPPSAVANLDLTGRSESPSRQAGRGGEGVGAGPVTSNNVWERLRHAEIIEEIKALYSEACNWYKKKGGALPLQVGPAIWELWWAGEEICDWIKLEYC